MDAADPPQPGRDHPPAHSRGALIWQRFRLLLPYDHSPPIAYNRGLVAYVSALALIALALGAAIIPANIPQAYAGGLIAGGLAAFMLAGMAVRTISGVSTAWSASASVHIGLSLAAGPSGALVASIAEALGTAARFRLGWFRTLFNASDFFLTDVSCWAIFTVVLQHGPHGASTVLFASFLVGFVYWAANYLPLAGVIRLATGPTFSVLPFMRESATALPYAFGYAYSGYVFVLVRGEGALGVTSAVASAVLLQGFLIFLDRRTTEHNAAQAEAARIEKELLQRAVDAQETERRRIAGELHDGVVQDLVGISLTMSAAGRITDDMSSGERTLAELLNDAAAITRTATGDLRTLMIEIAPPRLADAGLPAVLHELVSKVERAGIRPILDVSDNLGLNEGVSKLVYRVAQEGVRNAIKYSKATALTVRVTRETDRVVLTMDDDGVGFSAHQRAQRATEGHLGLTLLDQTAKDGGGTLAVTSRVGAGTTLRLIVPIAVDNRATPASNSS